MIKTYLSHNVEIARFVNIDDERLCPSISDYMFHFKDHTGVGLLIIIEARSSLL
jgi:hypothetical protein